MLPEINRIRKSSTLISVFRGLNVTENTGFSRVSTNSSAVFTEFKDMKNMSGDDYPKLRSRKKRSRRVLSEDINSNIIIANRRIIFLDTTGGLHYGDTVYTLANYDGTRQYLAQFGNNVVLSPRNVYCNLTTGEFTEMDVVVTSQSVSSRANTHYDKGSGFGFSIRKVELEEDGTANKHGRIFSSAKNLEDPAMQTIQDPGDEDTWRTSYYNYWKGIQLGYLAEGQGDSPGEPSVLYRCYRIEDTNKVGEKTAEVNLRDFTAITAPYVMITRKENPERKVFEGFEKGDWVTISGMTVSHKTGNTYKDSYGDYVGVLNNHTFKIYDKGDDYIVIKADLICSVPYTGAMTFSKVTPELDSGLLLEVSNRLWGCSSNKNEIYCCKQGDARQWNAYGDGTAGDSWAATVGNEGEFTGIARQNSEILFFKENWIMKLYGNKPRNFELRKFNVLGVEHGSEKSVVWVNGVVFYLSPAGVCQYAPGGQPVVISEQAFGNRKYKNAVAGRHKNKYYISAENEDGIYELFVFNCDTGIWYKEDDTHMLDTATYNNQLYYIDADSGELFCVEDKDNLLENSAEFEKEDSFKWSFETGNLYDDDFGKKYISKVIFGFDSEAGMKARVFTQYQEGGAWIELRALHNTEHGQSNVPVAVRRADYLKLRIEGSGDIRLKGIQIEFAGGSDKVWQF